VSFRPAPGSPFLTGGNASKAVAVGDVNGDGNPDVVTANGGGTVSVFLGDGSGGFTAATGSPVATGGTDPTSVAIGQLNGSGGQDLAVADFAGTVSVLLGSGTGTFSAAMGSPVSTGINRLRSLALGDVNAANGPDIITGGDSSTANNTAVLLNNGTAGFSAATLAVGAVALSIAVDNFDGNGLDFAAAVGGTGNPGAGQGRVAVMLGSGSGGFSAATNSPFATGGTAAVGVTSGDINKDGQADIVASSGESPSAITPLLGDGSGGFTAPVGSPVSTGGNAADSVALGDFDGDGNKDVAAANDLSGNVAVLRGDGSGGFAAAPGSPFSDAGPQPRALAVGDVNSDGAPDLVIVNQNGISASRLTVLVNAPVVSPSPSSLTFDAQTVGTTGNPRAVTATNSGAAPLHVMQANVSGSGDFGKAVDGCTGTIVPPGGSCSVSVAFSPAAAGERSATLTLSDDAADAPQSIALSGEGVAPAVSPGPGIPGPGGSRLSPVPPVASQLRIAPSAFPAADRGPSAGLARKTGTAVSYRLSLASTVGFAVERPTAGRKQGRRCVAPTRRNRPAHRCTRYVRMPGSFRLAGRSGANRFHFSGRVRGRKLSPGSYRLVATPRTGIAGRPVRAGFRILR
jgi:FG-GAP-like repeat/Abnormal spindle-like microcephaly-assoc'd, ASPM-SPD-2-Hydin